MEREKTQSSVDVQGFMKVKLNVPENEIVKEESKNSIKRRKKAYAKQLEEEKNQSPSVKMFLFGCVVVGGIVTLITRCTSAPSVDVAKATHVEKARYTKKVVVSKKDRGALGSSVRY